MIESEINSILSKIIKIILYRYNSDDLEMDISLCTGDLGLLLLQSQIYKHTNDYKIKNCIVKCLTLIIDQIEKPNSYLTPSYGGGLAGFGWIIDYLVYLNIIDFISDRFFSTLDVYLSESLDDMIDHRNYDQLYGAIGIGLYFLRRNNKEEVEKVINSLFHNAHKTGIEVKWAIFNQDKKKYVYDLGLAHGMAGIIYFLRKCHESDICRSKCLFMMNGCLSFYLNNIQNKTIVGSFFSHMIMTDEYPARRVQSLSRLAWCYGDLGILQSLYKTAKYLKDRHKEKLFENMIEETSKRKEYNETYVGDEMFCHGSSGVGYIYLDLYRISRNITFKHIVDFWADQTVKFAKNTFALDSNSGINYGKKGLLDGITGVGLFLLSYLCTILHANDLNENWKECVFL